MQPAGLCLSCALILQHGLDPETLTWLGRLQPEGFVCTETEFGAQNSLFSIYTIFLGLA